MPSKIKMKLQDEINLTNSSLPLIENEAYRELYRNFSLYVNENLINELDTIPHNEKVDGKEYKYGLLTKNELPFTDLIPKEEVEVIPKTSTENLFELLELDKDSSYESLLIKFQQTFSHGN
jgi:hypothetical protein